MKILIIPRGASPRRYKELVTSGQVVPQYREIQADGIDDQVEFQQAIDSQEEVVIIKAVPKKKAPKKTATGYQGGDRGFDNGGR